MNDIHGQWTRNNLLLQFRPELECYRLITGDDAKFYHEILAGKMKKNDYNNGIKCELHGKSVSDMSRHGLISFIGFLDDLATSRQITINQLEDSKALRSSISGGFKSAEFTSKPGKPVIKNINAND